MNELYDVLAIGIAAVDDLCYVSAFPEVDCKIPIHSSIRQGGGPACTAIAAVGSLGGHASYVARFGDNELSRFIRSALEGHGVDTSHIVLDPSGGPYHSFIVVDASGHRNVFYNPALYNVVGADDLSDSLIQSASLVLLDHITEPSLQGVAAKVKKLGVPILGDIEGPTETSVRLAALSDYLVVPKAFATWASDELEPKNSCAALAQGGRLATVVTAGVEGCYLSTPRNPTVRHFPAFRVDAFDTNGCGDTFHGAFALAVARGIDIEDTITFASAAAALKAIAGGGKRRGWDAIPTLEEVFQFLKAHLMEPERTTMLERLKTLRD